MKAFAGKHILLLVQNLSVPFDRRVWRESLALRENGFEVSVISPKGKNFDTEAQAALEEIDIYRYDLESDKPGIFAFFKEYASSVYNTSKLALKIYKNKPFHCIHTANPPDIFFIIAAYFKMRHKVKFVYDQHDLCPELFKEKFKPKPNWIILKIQYLFERLTFKLSDMVISTNESLKRIAIERGGKKPEQVFIVRNGPDESFANNLTSEYKLNNGFSYLCSYIGVMGGQDGVDNIIKAVNFIVNVKERSDIYFILMGAGEQYQNLRKMVADYGLDKFIEMPGRVPDEQMKSILSRSDVCLAPDPENDFNNWHTMNKIMDYMNFGKPIVSFDLLESKYSAGDSAVYIKDNDIERFASEIIVLIDNPAKRNQMGLLGRKRIETELAWKYNEKNLIDAYKKLKLNCQSD